jgi:predicted nucleic acid-binding protein
MANPIDTNVVVRYLVEDPDHVAPRFRGVFPFFEKLERGERVALLPPLVIFQTYFVLTSYYEIPRAVAAAKLRDLLGFKGLRVPEKPVLRACLTSLMDRSVDLVDAYLAGLPTLRGLEGIHSFDEDLSKLGVSVLDVD